MTDTKIGTITALPCSQCSESDMGSYAVPVTIDHKGFGSWLITLDCGHQQWTNNKYTAANIRDSLR